MGIKMRLPIASVVTGLLMIAVGANAAIKQGAQQIGLSLGVSNPLGNETADGTRVEFGKVGPALGLNYLYQVRPNWSLGADLNFKSFGDRDVFTSHGAGEVKTSAWTLMAVGRGDLSPESNLRPYALLGLGVGRAKRDLSYPSNARFDQDHASGGLAFALGAGLDFDINPTWVAGAELRYSYIHTDANEIGAESVRTLDVLFKAGYKF